MFEFKLKLKFQFTFKQVNARKEKNKHQINELAARRIKELNKADQMLYEYFTNKFDRQVKKFGEKRMRKEIEKLKERRKYFYNLCVEKTITTDKSKIVKFITQNKHNLECQFLTYPELQLTEFIRKEQIKKHPGSVLQKSLYLLLS